MPVLSKKITLKAANVLLFSTIAIGGLTLFVKSLDRESDEKQISIGKVLEEEGQVQIRNNQFTNWSPAKSDAPVYNRTTLFTEKASKVSFQVRNTHVQLGEKTLLQIIDPNTQTELAIDFGSLHLSSKKKEDVILNIGGEKVKLHLNDSDVKIQRDQKSGLARIESTHGEFTVESKGHTEIITETTPLDLATKPVAILEAPALPPEIKFISDSKYINDDNFAKRPTLLLSSGPESHISRYEVSPKAQQTDQWKVLIQNEFTPEREGEYQVRAVASSPKGNELLSDLYQWSVSPESFELWQPKLAFSQFVQNPLEVPSEENLFKSSSKPITEIEIQISSLAGTKIVEADPSLHIGDLPPGEILIRAIPPASQIYKFEDHWQKISISTNPPKPKLANDHIELPTIRSKYFSYEFQTQQNTPGAEVRAGNLDIPADCYHGCTLSFRYRNSLNPLWHSAVALLKIPPKSPETPEIERSMTAESDPTPDNEIAIESLPVLREQEIWNVEIGAGGNYLTMQTQSSLTNSNLSGFSGPTFYLGADRRIGNFGLKASILDINSKFTLDENGTKDSHTVQWRSYWFGGTSDGFHSLFDRLEYGLSYQEVPLSFQGASGSQFESGHFLSASVGFNSKFDIGEYDFINWDQRFLIPLSSSVSGSVESFHSEFGIEGSVSYYHCIHSGWAIGWSWLGQYTQASFSLPATQNLMSDSLKTSVLNSNIQVRLNYGICH